MTTDLIDISHAPHPFFGALISDETAPGIPAEGRIFDPFIGSWHLVVRWFDGEGRVTREEPGEWHFSRVLEGRGLQDVWIVPPRGSRGRGTDYEYGTSLRFYDPEIDGWRSLWIGPMQRMVRMFVARSIDSRVVLETSPVDSPRLRWTFSEVCADSFLWTNEIEEHGVWRTQQMFAARRQRAAGQAAVSTM